MLLIHMAVKQRRAKGYLSGAVSVKCPFCTGFCPRPLLSNPLSNNTVDHVVFTGSESNVKDLDH